MACRPRPDLNVFSLLCVCRGTQARLRLCVASISVSVYDSIRRLRFPSAGHWCGVTESVCGLGGVFYGKQHGWHSWVCDGYEVIRIAHEYYFLPWSPEW